MNRRTRDTWRGIGLTGVMLLAAGVSTAAQADIKPHQGMLRYPDVSKTHVVFSYANDLWIVPREGGQATPLASPQGAEAFPRFSADGNTIAFMGNYEGGRDLYTVNINGGLAERVTHHPTGEVLCDWTPDGDLMFFAGGIEGNPQSAQLFTVSASGGLPAVLPVPYGQNGAISPDGKWLAYTPFSRDHRTWKRYRGGMASDIWLFNLEDHSSERITKWEGTDSIPMWHGSKLYYLSDDGDSHRLNIWSYDTRNGSRKQVTRYSAYDVKWPSMGPGSNGGGEIIFQNGNELVLLDLRASKTRSIDISIPGDRETLRKRKVGVYQYTQGGDISPTGVRAAIEARGDIWTLPAENGLPRNLTRTDGIAERMPAWSPDGRWIAYFSDATGEYELYVKQSDGKGETKQLTSDGDSYRFNPTWSPNSEHIIYYDNAGSILMYSMESESTTTIDVDPWQTLTPRSVSWTQDSRWVTFSRASDESPLTSIWVHNIEDGESTQVTSGFFNETSPAFDRQGDFLYYTSARNFSPTYGDSGADTTWVYNDTNVLIAVPLREDVENPYALEVDEETWEEESDEDEAAEEESGDEEAVDDEADAEPASPIHGTWEGTVSGLSALGVPPEMDSMDFAMSITVDEDGSVTGSMTIMGESDAFDEVTFDEATGAFHTRSEEDGQESVMDGTLDGDTLTGTWSMMGASGKWQATKSSSDVDEDAADSGDDTEPVEIDFEGFERRGFMLNVSPGVFGQLAVNDKNQLLYTRMSPGIPSIKLFDLADDTKSEKNVVAGAGGFLISGDGKKMMYQQGQNAMIKGSGAGGSGKAVVTSKLDAMIDPREEWMQIYTDAWRLYRDFFYVENLHGVDWDRVHEDYAGMVKECVSRDDLNYVIGEMISELNCGHAYRFGGDVEGQSIEPVGLLGIDWELANGAYRVKRIMEGSPWDTDARNPLRAAGVNIKEGEYILAVNDLELDTSQDPWAAFVGLAGQTVVLTVSEHPTIDDESREVVLRPMGSERNLRYRGWIERNRKYVEDMTDGRVGYIYVPNTGVAGQNDLVRQFYGQMAKEALIIDERWNGGGQIPDRFIELLNRPRTNYWARRHGQDWSWPPDTHQGPKCMLINGLAGSGGDMFPALFRQKGLGPIIGTRTWGGLVGISGNPALIDGGYVAVPTFGFYESDGTWGIEGHGVDPDIEVWDDPALMMDGGDPQLDRAIAEMLTAIERNPYVAPDRPTDPDRSGMGVTEDDK